MIKASFLKYLTTKIWYDSIDRNITRRQQHVYEFTRRIRIYYETKTVAKRKLIGT
jgi:hypothetical protein